MKIKSIIYKKFTPFRIIALSFCLVILLGGILLWLPISSMEGSCSFLDALFTSCSAVCVTGLAVQNTATFWSPFGRVVLLLLIQVGGLGVVTSLAAIFIMAGKRLGSHDRNLMQIAVNAPQLGGIIRFTKFLLYFTAAAEGIGAVLLAVPFISRFGLAEGIANAVFHSVSAFCNAGFDLLGDKTPFVSLCDYKGDVFLNLVIMALIVTGGLGFLTWEELLHERFHYKKLSLTSRLALTVSLILIFLPAVYFFIVNFKNEVPGTRMLMSLFQSVTTRTAGFNTADFKEMTEGSRLVMIVLMLIGGSPGSTAGGLKTTTFAVILISFGSLIRQKKDVDVAGRRLPQLLAVQSLALLVLYVGLLAIGTVALSELEQFPVFDCMFECASALGTVGLTMGITPSLGMAGKILLILFMYFGRVGGLTLAYAALSTGKTAPGRLPEENVIVG